MSIGIEILKREIPSKIFLTLLIYKDGRLENGEEISAFKIAKLLYGPSCYPILAHVNREVNNLYNSGLIIKEPIIIKRKKRVFLLRPNLDKFVDLFIEYFNLNFTEEEKLKFKEWFKKVNWKILVYPYTIEEYFKLKLHGNIFEWIGSMLNLSSRILNFYRSLYENLSLSELKREIKSIIETIEKENYVNTLKTFNFSIDLKTYLKLLLNIFELPESLISKLQEIKISTKDSQLIDMVFNILALEHSLAFVFRPLIQKK